MCHPCWLNVKRGVLQHIASYEEGQSFSMLTHSFSLSLTRATVVRKQHEEGGVLVYLRLEGYQGWNGLRPFWCPRYGAGGWVDTQKDPKIQALLDEMTDKHNREADNCMAL